VLVNAAPVWHQSWKTLTKKKAGKCPTWKGYWANRRNISSDEHGEVKAALLSMGCQLTAFPASFESLFSEQANQGQRLCEPHRGICRKWVDGSAEGASPNTCFRQAPEFARTESANHSRVSLNGTERLLGRLLVGSYQGLP